MGDNNGEHFDFNNGTWHCIEMDKFWKKLAPGGNHVVRKSGDSAVTVPDVPSFQSLMMQLTVVASACPNLKGLVVSLTECFYPRVRGTAWNLLSFWQSLMEAMI